MKTAIIFGVTGQDGSHLADLLLDKDYDVIGVKRRASTDNTKRIKHILNSSRFSLIEGDVTDSYSVINILKDNEHVDEIYNLSAQSHVGTSFLQPALTWDVTAKGCLNILQSIVDLGLLSSRFYQASSSEMFGSSYVLDEFNNKFQNENTPFLPQSPYAVAKCAAHYTVRLFREAYKLHASSGILFNHEGPRRGENFVTKKIVDWLVNFKIWMDDNDLKVKYLCYSDDIIYGLNNKFFPKLRLGNIDSYRDWGYAGDYVEAMWLMLQQESADDYVVCTEQTYKVRDFLSIAFEYIGFDNWTNFVTIDKNLYRPAEVDFLKGSCQKAKNKLGWKPKYDLNKLIKLMIDTELNDKFQSNARHI